MKRMIWGMAATSMAMAAAPAMAQAPTAPPAADARADYAGDVKSVDAIMAALYDVISGDAGVKRDWNRFRNLFHPAARMIPVGRNRDGAVRASSMTPEDYVVQGKRLEEAGFNEREVARRVERFGPVTHVFSTYEAVHGFNGKPETMRGINSIQLFDDGQRWWVLNIAWSAETPDNPIPAKYLVSE